MTNGASVSGRLLARNTAFNIAGQAIPALVAMLAIPATIHHLGPERFGLIGLAWVVLGYFTYLDLGMGYAATRLLSEALGRGEPRRMPAIVASAAAVQLCVGVVGTVLVFAAAPFLVERVLRLAPSLHDDAIQTFRILSFAIPVVLVTTSFRAVLVARQRFGIVNAVTVPASTINFLIPLLGAVSGWSLGRIAGLLLAGRAAAMLAFLLLATHEIPGFLGRLAPQRGLIRELLNFGLWTTLTGTLAPLFGNLDRFLLGAFRSVAAVGFYTAPQELVLRLTTLPNSLVATLFPALTALDARNEVGRVRDLYGQSIRFLTVTVGSAALMLIAVGPDLLRLWLGEDSAAEAGVALQFLAAGILVNSIAYVPSAYLNSINRPDLPAKMHLFELPIFLTLAWLLMPRFGAAGAGAVWFARAALDTALMVRASDRRGMRWFEGGASSRQRIVMGILVATLGAAAVSAHAVQGMAPRFAAATALFAAFVWVGWTLLLSASDRGRLIALVRPPVHV